MADEIAELCWKVSLIGGEKGRYLHHGRGSCRCEGDRGKMFGGSNMKGEKD